MRSGTEVLDPAPPVPRDGGGGGGWAWLVTARGVMEAELIRGALEASGIVDVYLDATDPSPGAWLFLSGNVNALIRVFVLKTSLDDARMVLLEAGFGTTDPEPEPARAPRTVRWWVLALIALVILAMFVVATMRGNVHLAGAL